MPTELLEQAIGTITQDVAQQRQENSELKQQLERAIEEFNAYRTQSEMLRQALEFHCIANKQIADALPQRRQTIDQLLNRIKSDLSEVDRLLKEARQKHEETIAKVPLTF